MVPMLTEKSGLKVGEDIFICFSPERVDPGREDYTTYNTPTGLGGMTTDCVEVATAWYSGAIETVVQVSSAEAARWKVGAVVGRAAGVEVDRHEPGDRFAVAENDTIRGNVIYIFMPILVGKQEYVIDINVSSVVDVRYIDGGGGV